MRNSVVHGENAAPLVGPAIEMDAFDSLPPALRAMIRDALIAVGAERAQYAISRMGAARTIEVLRVKLPQDIPAVVRAAWGPDHPELAKFERMAETAKMDEARMQRRAAFDKIASNRRPGHSG